MSADNLSISCGIVIPSKLVARDPRYPKYICHPSIIVIPSEARDLGFS